MTKNISDGKRLNKFYKPTKMESLNSITPAKISFDFRTIFVIDCLIVGKFPDLFM